MRMAGKQVQTSNLVLGAFDGRAVGGQEKINALKSSFSTPWEATQLLAEPMTIPSRWKSSRSNFKKLLLDDS